jgi:hypothetical protein
MTTKDYVYLGLILLTALAFYFNGFYVGVYRCKRMYDALLDDEENEDRTPVEGYENVNYFAGEEKSLDYSSPGRGQNLLTSEHQPRGDFGPN